MSLPYYKRFPRDFLDGTIGLSLEVKGAYAIVLDLIYMRSGKLPDDGRYIAGQLGCSLRKWNSIRSELLERGKLTLESGFISNFRADYLLEETRKLRDKNAENGSKSKENKYLTKRTPPDTRAGLKSEPEPDAIEDKPSIVTKPAKPKPSKRAPENWNPSASVIAVGVEEGLSEEQIRRELAVFRDYTFSSARSDWDATFRNWLRKAAERKPNRNHADDAVTRAENAKRDQYARIAQTTGFTGEQPF